MLTSISSRLWTYRSLLHYLGNLNILEFKGNILKRRKRRKDGEGRAEQKKERNAIIIKNTNY